MTDDTDLLRLSMDAAPAEWLDRLVTERSLAQVQREHTSRPAPTLAPARAKPARWPPLRAWLSRFMPQGSPLLWRGSGRTG